MIKLHTSLRGRNLRETFRIAQSYQPILGISRVTETTSLDQIGIPVAVAIRPTAAKGSLIVTAGKGFHPLEAKTGALMEAIELAYSEEHHSELNKCMIPARKVLFTTGDPEAILSLCPRLDAQIDLDLKMSAVEIKDIISGQDDYLPAELLFIPFNPADDEPKYFGFHTNGLASGNSYEEAVIHAIYEIVERDILSFLQFSNTSMNVVTDSMPEYARQIEAFVKNANQQLVVQYCRNEHKIPFFKAHILEEWSPQPTMICSGYGCHAVPEIAMTRAMVEAIQSRMSYIHAGREDLEKGHHELHKGNIRQRFSERRSFLEENRSHILLKDIETPFSANLDGSIQGHLFQLIQYLQDQSGVQKIFVGRHTKKEEPLQVVKAIIPGMEFYHEETNRIGNRLHSFLEKQFH